MALMEANMAMQSQEATYNHLKVFRRCLHERRTGSLGFQTGQGINWLHMSDGYFLSQVGTDAVVRSIQSVLNIPVHGCVMRDLIQSGEKTSHIEAEEAVLNACYSDEIDSMFIQRFAQFFSRFPLVSVKLAPMHRCTSQFPGFDEYIRLYEMSVFEGGISLKDQLKSAGYKIHESVRLMMVLYLLGLIEPARERVKEERSVFGRLMRRVRTL